MLLTLKKVVLILNCDSYEVNERTTQDTFGSCDLQTSVLLLTTLSIQLIFPRTIYPN